MLLKSFDKIYNTFNENNKTFIFCLKPKTFIYKLIQTRFQKVSEVQYGCNSSQRNEN